MYLKNEKIELDIIDMTKDGLGVAKVGTQVFFVKDAIIGDKVTAIITKTTEEKKNQNVIYAKKVDILIKSIYRVEAKCDICDACGGCQVMKLDYKRQLLLKENYVKNDLMRIGSFDKNVIKNAYEGIIGMSEPYSFRNKMQVPFAVRDGRIIAGFYAGRTHYIVENENCITGFKEASVLIKIVKNMCASDISKDIYKTEKLTVYNETTKEGLLRDVLIRKGNKTNDISLTLIVNDVNLNGYSISKNDKEKHIINYYKKIAENILNNYSSHEFSKKSKLVTITLNINTDDNNVIFGKTNMILYGDGYINDELCGLKFHISPESFYQVNSIQTEKLYETAIEFIDGILEVESIKNALDLYCGIGTITLLLSKKVDKIYGIEIVDKAVENAIENAKINGINNAIFKCLDASKINNNECLKYELISIDPPRKGLDKRTIEYIKDVSPKYILYISCDSATLSRDLKILCDNTSKKCYNIEKIKCVDMFPHTMHVETVCLLTRES